MGTLVFAIYAGSLAFQQLMESRVDKFREYGDKSFNRKRYKRAIENYSEVLKIKPNDNRALVNSSEVYLLSENFEDFEMKLPLLKKNVQDSQEHGEILVYHYLVAVRYLLDQHNSKAIEKIKKIIIFVNKHPDSLKCMSWNFEDLERSDVYGRINGDAKKMLKNLISYLKREMSDGSIKKFEEGDYLLN